MHSVRNPLQKTAATANSSRISRDRVCLIVPLLLLPLVNFSLQQNTLAATNQADLSLGARPGTTQHVALTLDVAGQVKLNGEGVQVIQVPMKMHADLGYAEKWLKLSPSLRWAGQTVRSYDKTAAEITYRSDKPIVPGLRADRQIVAVAAPAADSVELFSPLGPLRRQELDLIGVPCNTALLDDLLPGRSVTVGDHWKLTCSMLAPLLGLDTITENNVQCELNRIENGLAIVHMTGTVQGAINGVSSEMKLAVKYAFHLTRHQISWLAMALHEDRAIGHAQPGLAVDVRLQLHIQSLSEAPLLHDSVLADLNLAVTPSALLLELDAAAAGCRILADRRWRAMINQDDVIVMRMIDKGELVAQCNLSPLAPLAKGQQFGMVEFQADIRRVLDKSFGEVTAADESISDDKIRTLRVAVTGTVDELPIQWIYYYLNDAAGRRISCVFTLESSLAERFGAADQSLMTSLRFTPAKMPAKPATATAAQPAPKPSGAIR